MLLTNEQKTHNDNESSKKETTVRSKRWISYFLVINNRLCLLHFIIPKSLFITSLYNELMFVTLLWTSEVTKLVLFIVSNFWSPLNLLYKTLSITEMGWGGGGWTETETDPTTMNVSLNSISTLGCQRFRLTGWLHEFDCQLVNVSSMKFAFLLKWIRRRHSFGAIIRDFYGNEEGDNHRTIPVWKNVVSCWCVLR